MDDEMGRGVRDAAEPLIRAQVTDYPERGCGRRLCEHWKNMLQGSSDGWMDQHYKQVRSMKIRYAVALALVLFAGSAFAFVGEQYKSQAKIPLAQARKTALATYSGQIISEELEKESGGSGLRYSFVIRQGKMKHEVGIDAKTGKVLENSVESERPD